MALTVGELIEILRAFPQNLEVVDLCKAPIEIIKQDVWVDSNYPYNRPDKDVLVIG